MLTGTQTGRIPELEGLRAVLAWTVVAAHVLICCGYFGPTLWSHNVLSDVAEAAVDVFIILSGFVITRLIIVEREPYHGFIVRRIRRIFPAYSVALAAAAATNGIVADNLRHFLPDPSAAAYVAISDIASARAWLDLPIHALLLQGLVPANWLPAEPYTFLGVAWSLSLEWQFYLLAPVAVWVGLRSRWSGVLLVIGSVGCALLSARLTGLFSNAFLPAKAAFFLLGGYCYIAGRHLGSTGFLKIVGLGCALTLAYLSASHRLIETTLPSLVWITAMSCIYLGVSGVVRRCLDSRLLQHLGKISYSTYLFHAPVIAVLQFAIWHFAHPANQRSLFLLTAPLAVAATYTVSYYSWKYVEKPFQKRPQRQPALP